MSDTPHNPADKADSTPHDHKAEVNRATKRPGVIENQLDRENVAAGSAGDRRRASKGER